MGRQPDFPRAGIWTLSHYLHSQMESARREGSTEARLEARRHSTTSEDAYPILRGALVFCSVQAQRRAQLLTRTGHSLHFGLSAPPTASQASVPGVVRETHDVL